MNRKEFIAMVANETLKLEYALAFTCGTFDDAIRLAYGESCAYLDEPPYTGCYDMLCNAYVMCDLCPAYEGVWD